MRSGRGSKFYRAFQLAGCLVRKPEIAKAMRKFNHNKKEMQNNIFKLLPWFIIAPLVIALCVTQCNRQAEKVEVRTFDSTAIFKSKLEAIQKQGAKQLTAARKDSIQAIKVIAGLQIENKILRQKLRPVRVEVEKIADTVAIVKRYLGIVDSLDRNQNEQIDSLTAQRNRIWGSLNQIVLNRNEQIQVLTELSDHQSVVNKDLRRQVRKERRRKTFFKITTGIAATLVLYLAIQD